MIELNKNDLLLSTQRALLFNVIPIVRFIFIEVNNNVLNMWVYTDDIPSEDEKDMYYSVAGEIDGDFPELDGSNVEFFVSILNFEEIAKLKHLVYARYESPSYAKSSN